jgi:hypothetical protein
MAEGIKVDLTEFNWFAEAVERRLTFVQDIEAEGRAYADAHPESLRPKPKSAQHPATTRRLIRPRRLTAGRYARSIEHAAYKKLIDWWGNW